MILIKSILVNILLGMLGFTAFATSWDLNYAYIQTSENSKIKSHSVPYGVDDGPNGLGQTFVYSKRKLLYVIDRYFTSPFLTTNNGKYLIEIAFYLDIHNSIRIQAKNGNVRMIPIYYNGNALKFFKNGILYKTISFSELKIDTSKIKKSLFVFSWNFSTSDTMKDKLLIKMENCPAFIENGKLYLITIDNQLITVDIATAQITNWQSAYETLKQKLNWLPTIFNRDYRKVKYPETFLLPTLKNGKTLAQGLAEFLNKKVSQRQEDSAVI